MWFKLLEVLASTENHFFKCNLPVDYEYLCRKLHVDNTQLKDILKDLADLEAIDPLLWNNEHIIWSENFIKNISEVYHNRRRALPIKPNNSTPSLPLIYNDNSVSCRESRVERVERVEYSRVEESTPTTKKNKKTTIKSFDDYKKEMKERFNDLNFGEELEKFDLYWKDGKRKLKNPKLALFNWLTKAKEYKLNRTGVKNNGTSGRGHKPEDYENPEEFLRTKGTDATA
jgi:hypothetical protein